MLLSALLAGSVAGIPRGLLFGRKSDEAIGLFAPRLYLGLVCKFFRSDARRFFCQARLSSFLGIGGLLGSASHNSRFALFGLTLSFGLTSGEVGIVQR